MIDGITNAKYYLSFANSFNDHFALFPWQALSTSTKQYLGSRRGAEIIHGLPSLPTPYLQHRSDKKISLERYKKHGVQDSKLSVAYATPS